MPLHSKDVAAKLTGKFGFTRKNGKHIRFHLTVNGKLVASTMLSHDSRELSPSLETAMARQLKVGTATFKEMISCTVSRDDYEAMFT